MKNLFVQVRYYLKKGKRDDFYQKFRDNNICEMSQSEIGNVEYEIYMPHDSENDVCLLKNHLSCTSIHSTMPSFASLKTSS